MTSYLVYDVMTFMDFNLETQSHAAWVSFVLNYLFVLLSMSLSNYMQWFIGQKSCIIIRHRRSVGRTRAFQKGEGLRLAAGLHQSGFFSNSEDILDHTIYKNFIVSFSFLNSLVGTTDKKLTTSVCVKKQIYGIPCQCLTGIKFDK